MVTSVTYKQGGRTETVDVEAFNCDAAKAFVYDAVGGDVEVVEAAEQGGNEYEVVFEQTLSIEGVEDESAVRARVSAHYEGRECEVESVVRVDGVKWTARNRLRIQVECYDAEAAVTYIHDVFGDDILVLDVAGEYL